MADFLEEVVYGVIKYGSSWQDDYSVNIVTTSGGNEYRSLIHPLPARKFVLNYELDRDDMWTDLIGLWHRAHGKFAGFRARCHDEYSSNGAVGTPTPLDQSTLVLTATTRQLIKAYGLDKTAGATGYAYRHVKKPVSGTVVAAKNGVTLGGGDFSVNTTTGVVTVPTAIITDVITAGFQFDFPVRFNTSLPVGQDYPGHRIVDGVELMEILNP